MTFFDDVLENINRRWQSANYAIEEFDTWRGNKKLAK